MKREWYSINAKSDSVEILIYDVIGEDFWGEGVSAKAFVEDLNSIDSKNINVRINSPGGDVYEGNAIYNALRMHKANVNIQIDGVAASIASVIAMAGDTVQMSENALFMVHNPWTFALGNANELRKVADTLDKAQTTLLSAYRNKTGLEDKDIVPLLDAETWLTASEAKEKGFIDEILEPVKMAACSTHYMFKGFKNLPEQLQPEENEKSNKIWLAKERLDLSIMEANAS